MDIALLDACVDRLLPRLSGARPQWAIVLGSGWGSAAGHLNGLHSIPYSDFSPFEASHVPGHEGRLHLARHDGMDVLIFQGRRHWYEGLGWEPVILPVYIARRLNLKGIILTNAAGGIRADLTPGALMVIDDHINGLGASPLVGPQIPGFGPRFPDMSAVYTPRLRALLDMCASGAGHALAHGIYLAASGPAYETPAEIRAFRTLGADAVGMSTVPEATLAAAAGLEVAGLSCISNFASGIAPARLSHADVVETGKQALPRLTTILKALLARLAAERGGSGPARP